jgi:hypothetical protein
VVGMKGNLEMTNGLQRNRSGGYKRIFYPIECHPDDMPETKITALNPPGNTRRNVRIIRGEEWEKMLDDPNWIHAGYVPAPRTIFWVFVYHFCMGALMHYPLLSILRFCFNPRSLQVWPEEVIPKPPKQKFTKVTKKPRRSRCIQSLPMN